MLRHSTARCPTARPTRTTTAPSRTDNIGMNYDYPDGDYATRERISREHETYQQGLMWTSWPTIPACRQQVRERGQALGPGQGRVHRQRQLAAPALRARGPADGRRLRDDRARLPRASGVAEDSVGLARLQHGLAQRPALRRRDGAARNEGDVQVGVPAPYPISYRSIVPKAARVHEPARAGVPVGARTSPTARSAWSRCS